MARRVGDLVMEAVAGQGGVVRLEVELVLVLEAVADEETVDRRGIVVVLVLCRLLRLRLDEQQPLEPDPVLVIGDHRQEPGELVLLAGEVGVEEGVVALATAPQHIVRAAEAMRGLEHVLDLGRGVGEHLRIRVRGRAGHVPGHAEQVGGAPQQPEAGPAHLPLDEVDDLVEERDGLLPGALLRRDVTVVEAEEGDAQLVQELEGRLDLHACGLEWVDAGCQPWPVERAHAEHVDPRPGERVPQADADAEVVLHALAEDHPVGVVDGVGQRVRRLGAAEGNPPWDLAEKRVGQRAFLRCRGCRPFDTRGELVVELSAGASRVVLDPVRGGRLASWTSGGEELLVAPPDAADASIHWGCFVMAPWPGRLAGGRFDWRGRTIQLPRTHGRHAIHGLTWNQTWSVEEASGASATLAIELPPAWPMRGRVRQ